MPASGMNSFYPRTNNQQSVKFQVMECLASDSMVDPELGKEIGTAVLALPGRGYNGYRNSSYVSLR